jgi:hypothetical protein
LGTRRRRTGKLAPRVIDLIQMRLTIDRGIQGPSLNSTFLRKSSQGPCVWGRIQSPSTLGTTYLTYSWTRGPSQMGLVLMTDRNPPRLELEASARRVRCTALDQCPIIDAWKALPRTSYLKSWSIRTSKSDNRGKIHVTGERVTSSKTKSKT